MKKSAAPKSPKQTKTLKNEKPSRNGKASTVGKGGGPRYLTATTFTIITPVVGARVLLVNYNQGTGVGNLTVRALRMGSGFASIYARVDAASGIPMPAAPDATLTQLHRVGTTEEFRSDVVPATVPMDQDPVAPGMQVPGPRYLRLACYDSADVFIEDDTVIFTAIPPVMVTKVSSRACLFLAFADDGYIMPEYNESPGTGFRPTGLVVPSTCNQATIAVVANGPWGHHPTNDRQSGAEGLAGTENLAPLQRADLYKSGATQLKSDNINGSTPLPLNMLVGLVDRGHTMPSVELPIGAGTSFTFNDPQPTKFHLGFHDGFQWSNNTDASGAFGEVQVRVTWSSSIPV